ncbi:DUF1643 domain-containing protein [Arthrobacter bussei]|uniref:DUF1643 domain-containing protein n=1 Tax=Arthrobacter bussei TaxID=2594179 RepID=A0A7X1NSN6_9MICC|nr:DUF1643 domain-containing protein [Arthrobacter bussei]
MLNPSTADGYADDGTIRCCLSLVDAAGVKGLRVVNLFAYRSTDPAGLKAASDAAGGDDTPAEVCRCRVSARRVSFLSRMVLAVPDVG